MKKYQIILKYILLFNFILFSTLLFSQNNIDEYGFKTGDFKKLLFKVRLEMKDYSYVKGYLKELKDSSVIVAKSKFGSVHTKEVEILEVLIENIRSLHISRKNHYFKDLLIAQGIYVACAAVIDLLLKDSIIDDAGLRFGFITAMLTIVTFPTVFLAAGLINSFQQIKVKINGSLEKYKSSKKLLKAYLIKKNNKIKGFSNKLKHL